MATFGIAAYTFIGIGLLVTGKATVGDSIWNHCVEMVFILTILKNVESQKGDTND